MKNNYLIRSIEFHEDTLQNKSYFYAILEIYKSARIKWGSCKINIDPKFRKFDDLNIDEIIKDEHKLLAKHEQMVKSIPKYIGEDKPFWESDKEEKAVKKLILDFMNSFDKNKLNDGRLAATHEKLFEANFLLERQIEELQSKIRKNGNEMTRIKKLLGEIESVIYYK